MLLRPCIRMESKTRVQYNPMNLKSSVETDRKIKGWACMLYAAFELVLDNTLVNLYVALPGLRGLAGD